ncbi:polysaccharide deacetylase family protein [Lysobacter sp. K5869]|uniref:polysaccharide deacetylase family protein n=1 Tax=Lysobacter sp. K5869 TaxID=2820808 RepID=UPI001C06208E|nr:polysaccharide deacetylase family protein [Lysobacter sp. K5869]QWP75880.1 polysaccharide deacetylase family protein [Lysobacter sp. K5869]
MDYHAFLAQRPRAYLGRGLPHHRAVALSFDDGPGQATPALLATLRELQVTATFFCIGRLLRAVPWLSARMLADGHELANHSMSHADASGLQAEALLHDEVAPAAAELRRAGADALSARLYRPAFGEIRADQVDLLARHGYTVAGWSIDPCDWLEPEAPGHVDCVSGAVLAQAHPGAIVLLHDGDDDHGRPRPRIVEIVRELVPALRAQGYGFVRVGDLLREREAQRELA